MKKTRKILCLSFSLLLIVMYNINFSTVIASEQIQKIAIYNTKERNKTIEKVTETNCNSIKLKADAPQNPIVRKKLTNKEKTTIGQIYQH